MIIKRIAAALCAVFLFVPVLGGVAYAAELGGLPDVIAEEVDAETGAEMDIDEPDTADPSVSAIDETAPLVAPPGTGTVVEHGINGDNKEFYTIMTAEQFVFYLIIDHERAGQNVYFLNAVTIYDLAALAEQDGATVNNGSISAIPGTNTETPKPSESAHEPSPEPKQEPGGGNSNTAMIIFVVVVLLGGGGIGYYFKIYRPKQQGADTEDDYDYSEDEADPYGGNDAEPVDNGGDQAWYDADESADEYGDIAGDYGDDADITEDDADGGGDGEE